MKATFQECFLVNFAIDPAALRTLLPKPIQPRLFKNEAYLSIVIARLYRMRPTFVPAAFGVTFNQVVYRVVAECKNEKGVFFLRSDADNRFMSFGGELLTNFNFHTSNISTISDQGETEFSVRSSPPIADISSRFLTASAGYALPVSSRFDSLDEAKQFLVELYQAFSINAYTGGPMSVKIRRGEWDIRVVQDKVARYQFMQDGPYFNRTNSRLDSIFYIKDVDYCWQVGKKLV